MQAVLFHMQDLGIEHPHAETQQYCGLSQQLMQLREVVEVCE